MKSPFQKISRVRSLTGGTRWYLSHDCLLAAKRTLYAVEYRRFYLRDLESVVVWPRRFWLLRVAIPGLLFAALGASLWLWVDATAGQILVAIGVGWAVLEFARGATARARIRTSGAIVELPLVARMRLAPKVLAMIDAAVRAARGASDQPATLAPVALSAESHPLADAEARPTASIATAAPTNAS
jgi:hypothetical protein